MLVLTCTRVIRLPWRRRSACYGTLARDSPPSSDQAPVEKSDGAIRSGRGAARAKHECDYGTLEMCGGVLLCSLRFVRPLILRV